MHYARHIHTLTEELLHCKYYYDGMIICTVSAYDIGNSYPVATSMIPGLDCRILHIRVRAVDCTVIALSA
eukprot:4265920-Pleurochrysis_carterae.AAC.1